VIDPDHQVRTARLLLRATRERDAPRFAQIQSNWNVTRMLRQAPWPVVEAEMAAWVATHAEEWTAGTAYRFAVERDGEVIGVCDLDDIAGDYGEIGYWYDEAHWGGGVASEAAQALVRFALDEVSLNRLLAGHAADNPASGRVLERVGFRFRTEITRYSRPHGEDRPYRTYTLHRP
jgi:ribosomal-protein-alanine N-acetyltransferase